MKIHGMHHIALSVKNFQASKDFYEKGLGMKVIRTWINPFGRDYCMLDIGDGSIIELSGNGNEETPQNAFWLHLAIRVDNVQEVYDQAVKAGATEQTTPRATVLASDPPCPIEYAFVRGIDGEQIEIFKEV